MEGRIAEKFQDASSLEHNKHGNRFHHVKDSTGRNLFTKGQAASFREDK